MSKDVRNTRKEKKSKIFSDYSFLPCKLTSSVSAHD
jgi:hypothetical protein